MSRLLILGAGGSIAGLLPPTLLVADADTHLWINLSWQDNSTGETGFKIERSADGVSGWAQIDTATEAYYSDLDVNPGETWYYRVRAYDATSNSNYSNVANATVITLFVKANFNASNQGYSNGQALDTTAEGVQAGSLTVVDAAAGSLALSAYRLYFIPSGTTNQTGFYSNSLSRVVGQGLFLTVIPFASNTLGTIRINNAGALTEASKLFQLNIAADARIYPIFWNPANNNFLFTRSQSSYAAYAVYEICIVVGGYNSSGVPYRSGQILADFSYGYTMYIRGGEYDQWFRIWDDIRDNTTPVYWVLDTTSETGYLDDVESSDNDLSSLLIPTDYIAAPAAAATFTHEDDNWIEFTVTTVPTAGEIEVDYRIQDATNRRRIVVQSDGTLTVGRVVAGVYTAETTRAGVVNGTNIIVQSRSGAFLEFINRVLPASQNWTNMTTSFTGNIGGEVASLGTGGVISNLTVFPLWSDTIAYSEVLFNNRQTVLTGNATHEDSNAYEPSVIVDNDPQILTGTVYKMWYTGGWSGGVFEPSVNYAESTDGISWTKYGSNPVISNHFRGYVFKNGTTYYAYVIPSAGVGAEQQIDRYSSADGITWALDSASVLSVGAGGSWDDTAVANPYIWLESGTWYMLYEARSAGVWKIGLATAPDGLVWTKSGSNPVITEAGSVGGPDVKKIGATYMLWAHRSNATLPTDITSYTSPDLINWTIHPTGFRFLRQFNDEGPGGAVGQVADPDLVEVDGQVLMFYSASTDGSQASGQQHIKVGIFDGTLEALLAQ